MSDVDVKVKFGADFSEINEGAETAVKSSGSALSKYFSDYAKGLKDKLAKAFSLDSIVSNIMDGMSERMEKFKEIDTLSRKLNVSRVELQQFEKIGKEFNIGIEAMGRNIAYANRTLGASANGSKTAQENLAKLGFTQKEITSGNIKATDVLYKLAEQYEVNAKRIGTAAASNILANNTTNMFGKGSDDLVTILKEGNAAIRDRIKLMDVYSESEVRGGARLARQKEKAEGAVKKIYGKAVGFFGGNLEELEMGKIQNKAMQKAGWEYTLENQINKEKIIKENPKLMQEIAKNMKEIAKEKGINESDLADMLRASKMYADRGFNKILADEIEKGIKKTVPGENEKLPGAKALVASSLQEIGGGDIGSVMAGLGPNAIAENTLRTAVATEQIAAQGPAQTKPATLR